jgi:hypothetical protein
MRTNRSPWRETPQDVRYEAELYAQRAALMAREANGDPSAPAKLAAVMKRLRRLQHRQVERMQARFDREDREHGESRALSEQAEALLAKYAHLLPQTTAAAHPGENQC